MLVVQGIILTIRTTYNLQVYIHIYNINFIT